jgi:hypothetical protein
MEIKKNIVPTPNYIHGEIHDITVKAKTWNVAIQWKPYVHLYCGFRLFGRGRNVSAITHNGIYLQLYFGTWYLASYNSIIKKFDISVSRWHPLVKA